MRRRTYLTAIRCCEGDEVHCYPVVEKIYPNSSNIIFACIKDTKCEQKNFGITKIFKPNFKGKI